MRSIDMTVRLSALSLLAMMTMGTVPALAQGASGTCVVNDPTGSPLNVRSEPNGAILSTLFNGDRIEPVDETTHNAKRWLLVAQAGRRIGWVFANYVLCEQEGGAVDAAPTPPSDQR